MMTRRSRRDVPGSWHHVINRGIARRTVFEGREDMKYFQSRLPREFRRGRIEVQVFSFGVRRGSSLLQWVAFRMPKFATSIESGAVMEGPAHDQALSHAYRQHMGKPLSDDASRWVEARILSHPRSSSRHDDMLLSAPERPLDWMRRKASLANDVLVALSMQPLSFALRC